MEIVYLLMTKPLPRCRLAVILIISQCYLDFVVNQKYTRDGRRFIQNFNCIQKYKTFRHSENENK